VKSVDISRFGEFANFAYVELADVQGLRCIMFHFQRCLCIFNVIYVFLL